MAPGKNPALRCGLVRLWMCTCVRDLLEQTQEDSSYTEASKVLHKSSAHHDNSPKGYYYSHEDGRTIELVEDHVAWYL